jgi:hypothetical protein
MSDNPKIVKANITEQDILDGVMVVRVKRVSLEEIKAMYPPPRILELEADDE